MIATRDAGTIVVAEPRAPITKTAVASRSAPKRSSCRAAGRRSDAGNAHSINRLEGVVTEVSYLGGVTTYKVKLDTGAILRSSMANTARLDIDAYQCRPARGGVVHARRLRGAGAMSARRIFARPARLRRDRALSLDGAVLSGAIRFRAQDRPVADRDRAAALSAGVRPDAGVAAIKAAFAALSLDNFRLLISDDLYVLSYLRSLVVAAVSTSILLLIGYPIAYGMARLPRHWQSVAMMLVIVPFWTSFLIRIYAWINILQHDGLLNKILLALHLVSAPVVWLSTDSAMYLGIVYSYLPFMILPLYATLAKMEPALLEAASDLGASPREAFWLVTFPLSLPGVAAGVLLCFIPIVGEFVIPDLLAGSGLADDRPDPVAGILHQQGLAGGVGGRRRAAGAAAGSAACCYDRLQRRQLERMRGDGERERNKISRFNVVSLALGLAFLYLPIVILVIYSFNASRLVTVWGGWSLRWYRNSSTTAP